MPDERQHAVQGESVEEVMLAVSSVEDDDERRRVHSEDRGGRKRDAAWASRNDQDSATAGDT